MIYWIAWAILYPFYRIFWPTKIIGKKFIKQVKKESAILCCNHQTNNDPILLKLRIKPTAKVMAKKSLFKSKLGSWFLNKCGAYPVERGATDINAVKTTLKILKAKKQIIIFPEGTRVQNTDALNMKSGVVTFAIKTDSYIVPMFFRKNTKPFRRNQLLVGQPFKLSDFEDFKDKKNDKELITKANEILTEKMLYLKNVDIKEYKNIIKNK